MRRPSPRVARNRRRAVLYVPLFLAALALWRAQPEGVINSGHALAAVLMLAALAMVSFDEPRSTP